MNPRAVALRGIGYGPRAMATRGYLLVYVRPSAIVAYERLEAQCEPGVLIRLALARFLDVELEAIAMIEQTAESGAVVAIPAQAKGQFGMDSETSILVEIEAPFAASIALTVQAMKEE